MNNLTTLTQLTKTYNISHLLPEKDIVKYDSLGRPIYKKIKNEEIWLEYHSNGKGKKYLSFIENDYFLRIYNDLGKEILYETPLEKIYTTYNERKQITSQVIYLITKGGETATKYFYEYDEFGNNTYYKQDAFDKVYEIWMKYDKNNNEIYSKDIEGREVIKKYDENNMLIYLKQDNIETSWVYDDACNLLYKKELYIDTNEYNSTQFFYTPDGILFKKICKSPNENVEVIHIKNDLNIYDNAEIQLHYYPDKNETYLSIEGQFIKKIEVN
jgi:hypothetical protein